MLGLAVVLRVLGFGYLLAGKRGPGLLVGLLLVTTLGAWSPWLAVTALGAGLAVAGAFRLPRWQLLAVGMALFLGAGAGYVAETVVDAQQEAGLSGGQRTAVRVGPAGLGVLAAPRNLGPVPGR